MKEIILFILTIPLHEGGHYVAYRFFGYKPNLRLRWFGFEIGANCYKKINLNKMLVICLSGILGGLIVAIFSPIVLLIYLISCMIDFFHILVYMYLFAKGYNLREWNIDKLESKGVV